jgi:hypothetical protein
MIDQTETDIRRGKDAEALLAHPLLVEAFELIEQELTQEWRNSPARDEEAREKLWLTLKCLHKVRGQLQHVVETGQFARMTLAQRVGERLSQYF